MVHILLNYAPVMNFKNKIFGKIKIAVLLAALCLCGSPVYGVQLSATGVNLAGLINEQRELGFELNPVLCEVARDHARRFVIEEFAQGQEPESSTPLTLGSVGYKASAMGEQEAMVLFSNYLGSDAAAHILFDSIKKQSEESGEDGGIFSSQFSEMGIFILQESIFLGNTRFNVYLAVVIYANPMGLDSGGQVAQEGRLIMEERFLNMVNQLRNRTHEVIAENDISMDDIQIEGLSADGCLTPVKPAFIEEPDAKLHYFYEYSGDDSSEAIGNIFSHLLDEEMVRAEVGESLLLNPVFNAMDVQITREAIEIDGVYRLGYAVMAGFGEIDQNNIIQGLFYSDDNLNDLYDPGEELSNIPMIVYDAGVHSRTGIAGGVFEGVEDIDKGYQLVLFPPDHEIVIKDINELNKFVSIKL